VSFVAPLCVFLLGSVVGAVGGIVLGFVWYEHKCGLLSDHSGKRAAGIRFELDDVFERSNSEMGVRLPREVNLPSPDHSTTRLSWEKRTGNKYVSTMRNVPGRPTAG
jgi:hypothetical protein